MIDILLPRTFFITFSLHPTSSCPSNLMDPETILPVGASICMMEYAVTDLPEPDSPTIPSTFPRSRLKETPLTALTSPASVKNDVCRSFTSRSCIGCLFLSQPFNFGSKASLRPSPSRFKDNTISDITTAGITRR